MTRTRFAAVAAVTLVSATATYAQPQPPVVATRPTFSPYLNLLRGGGSSPALNYFGLVRPEQQFMQQQTQLRQQLQQTNQQLQAVNQAVIAGGDPNLPETGHAAVFNNTLHYFGGQPGSSGARVGGYPTSAGASLPHPGSRAVGSSGLGGTAGLTTGSSFGGTAGNGFGRR